MSETREISDALVKIIRQASSDDIKLFYATVTEVNEEGRSCTIKTIDDDSDNTIEDVQLMAEPNDGFLRIPSIGSEVIAGYNKTGLPFVVCFGQLDKVICSTDTVFQFDGGDFKGMVKVEDLVEKINALEEMCNNLLSTLQGITIPLAPSGTYPFAPEFASILPIDPVTQVSDLENTKVTH